MSISDFKGGIPYAPNDQVTAAQLNLLRAEYVKAIDGTGGGTYSPSAAISVGSAGLTLTGASHKLPGTLTVQSGGTLTCASGSALTVSSGCAVNVTVASGGTIAMASGSTFSSSGTINHDGTHNLNAGGKIAVKSGAELEMQGSSTLDIQSGCTMSIACDYTVTGKETKSGSGARTIPRVSTSQNDTSFSATVANDVWRVTTNGATVRTATCLTSSSPVPAIGEMMIFRYSQTGSGTLNIVNEGFGTIAACTGADGKATVTVLFDGGRWRLVSYFQDTGMTVSPGADA